MKYPGLIIENTKFSAETRAIKERLNKLGYGTFDITNSHFGPTTKLAVKEFQKDNHLLPDGKVGELTWARLFVPYVITTPGHATSLASRALEIAISQLKVRELTGKNDGEAVEAYLKEVGLSKGLAWCMAFVYWCYEQAEKELSITSPLIKTGGVLNQWNKIDPKYKFTSPKVNDIFIMDFGGGKGHTGIITNIEGDRVHTIEGNTSADPSTPNADREGNGVFERSRKQSSIKGYIRIPV